MTRAPIDAILELPAAERVEVVQKIWESIAAHPENLALTEPQRAELERRWQALQRDPDAGESWEDVKRSLAEE